MAQSSDLVRRLFKSCHKPDIDAEILQNNASMSSQVKLIEISLAENERQVQKYQTLISPRKQSFLSPTFKDEVKQSSFMSNEKNIKVKAMLKRMSYVKDDPLPQINVKNEQFDQKLKKSPPFTSKASKISSLQLTEKFKTALKSPSHNKKIRPIQLSKDISEDFFLEASNKIAFGRGTTQKEQQPKISKIDREIEKRTIQLKKAKMDSIIASQIKLVSTDPDEKRRAGLLESSQSSLEEENENWDGKLPALPDNISLEDSMVKAAEFNITGLTYNSPELQNEPGSGTGILRKKKEGSRFSVRNRSNFNVKSSIPSVTITKEMSHVRSRRNQKEKQLSQFQESNFTFTQTKTTSSLISRKTMMDLGQKFLPRVEKKDTMTYAEMRKLMSLYQVAADEFDQYEQDPLLRQLAAISKKQERQLERQESKTKLNIESMIMQLLGIEYRPQNLERITEKLLHKVYDDKYDEIADRPESITAEFAKEIRDKKIFYDLCKSSLAPSVNQTNQQNHLLRYFLECQEQNVVALPILFKIKNFRLKLENYTLNAGICESFAKAIEIFPEILDSITLAYNGLKDIDLHTIIEALTKLKQIKSISIKNNEIMNLSTQGILQILDRSIPDNLEELQLVSCKTNALFTNQIIQKLQYQCHLRKLSLVQMSLTSNCDILEKILMARFLVELDISWNELKPIQLLSLSKQLAENRQLRSVNLSWNQMTSVLAPSQITAAGGAAVFNIDAKQRKKPKYEFGNTESKFDEQDKAEFEHIVRPPDASLDRDSYTQLLNRENAIHPLAQMNREITKNLCTFIKRNKSLLHFDLSECNLTEYMLWNIGSALSRAKSIISIHLSGNQGITPALKMMLKSRIRCKPEVAKKFHINLEKGFNDVVQENLPCLAQRNRDSQLYSSGGLSRLKNNYEKKFVQQQDTSQVVDQMKLRLYNSKKVADVQITGYVKESNQLILSRKLGHKKEMPGSGQWRMLSNGDEKCWWCDRHNYSMFFWSCDQGEKDQNQISPFQEDNVIEQIKNYNNDFDGVNFDGPVFFTAENNWQPQKLFTLEDYLYKIDSKAPDYFKELRYSNSFRPEVKLEKDLNQKERDKLVAQIDQYKKRNYTSSDALKRVLFNELRYRQPELVNSELIMDKDLENLSEEEKIQNQTYCFPSFWKQGKHMVVIGYPDSYDELEFFIHRAVIRQREEEIPIFTKKTKMKTTTRKFNKQLSIFKDWQEDTPEILSQVIDHDSKLWKVERFAKEQSDLPKIIEALKKYCAPIKNAYIQTICRSVYPGISSVDFFNHFSRKAQICSEAESAFSDRTFIAIKNQPVQMEGKDQTTICRYEFIESVVRFADQIYYQTGTCSTISEGVQKLVEEKLFKHFPYDGWQEFRQENVWTLPTNDVLMANKEGVLKLMSSRYTARKQFLTLKDILQMICRDSGLNIGEPEVKYCYGMSKMTNVNEKNNFKQYFTIKEPEFMEFLVRLAHYKYSTWQQPINVKLELLLDDLFKMIGFKRVPVKVDIEEQSESDDDY